VSAALGREALLGAIAAVVDNAAGGSGIERVCIAVPSFVMADGSLGPIPSLPALEGVHLDLDVRARTTIAAGATVTVVPDLSAAALGEWRLGVGRGVSRFLCVAIGTGVNAGAVVEGRLVETAFGSLGDAGHVLVDPAGPACPCGGVGCLEAVCSGFALARDGAPMGLPDARAVVDAAREGDERAAALIRAAGTALGRAVSSWSVLMWPQVVAVAGGVSAAGDLLLDPARDELHRIGPPYVCQDIRLLPAELGASATLAGAALLAG
jgi:glucokinase